MWGLIMNLNTLNCQGRLYYIDSGWLGDQYCLLLAEAVILVEAVEQDQYQLLRPIKDNIG